MLHECARRCFAAPVLLPAPWPTAGAGARPHSRNRCICTGIRGACGVGVAAGGACRQHQHNRMPHSLRWRRHHSFATSGRSARARHRDLLGGSAAARTSRDCLGFSIRADTVAGCFHGCTSAVLRSFHSLSVQRHADVPGTGCSASDRATIQHCRYGGTA